MKKVMRFLALTLVIISILSISIPAMAAGLSAVPGESRTTGEIFRTPGSRISYSVSGTLSNGDIVRVFLDVFNPERNGWVERDSVKFESTGTNGGTLSYTLDTNEDTIRIRTYGYESNLRPVYITYSQN